MSTNNSAPRSQQQSPTVIFALSVLVFAFLMFLFWYTQHDSAVKSFVFLSKLLIWPLYWLELGSLTSEFIQSLSEFAFKMASKISIKSEKSALLFANIVLCMPLVALIAGFLYTGPRLEKKMIRISKNYPFNWIPPVACNALAFTLASLILVRLLGVFAPNWFASTSVLLDSLTYMKKNPSDITSGTLFHFSNMIGRLYYAPLIALTMIYISRAKNHPRNKYRFSYNIETFLQDMTQEFKAAVPVIRFDPIDKDIPGYEPSRSALSYCKHNNLYIEKYNRFDVRAMQKIFIQELGNKFIWAKTPESFSGDNFISPEQLWKVNKRTFENFSPWQKAIFGILASVIATRDKEEAFLIRDAINESGRLKEVDLKLALPLFKKYAHHPEVLKVILGHQYVSTILMQMFVSVREWTLDLHPAQFIWLKPINRPFWYAQHCTPLAVERIDFAAFAEGLGIISQWQVERTCLRSNGYYHPDFPPFQISAAASLINELEKVGIDARICKLANDECWSIFATPLDEMRQKMNDELEKLVDDESKLEVQRLIEAQKNEDIKASITNKNVLEQFTNRITPGNYVNDMPVDAIINSHKSQEPLQMVPTERPSLSRFLPPMQNLSTLDTSDDDDDDDDDDEK